MGSLPNGEIVNDLVYLQGYLVIATSTGFRVGQLDEGISYGPLVPIKGGVSRLCVDGRWVLFAWSGYEPSGFPEERVTGAPLYSGLGRIDLSTFTAPLVPGLSPDLMVESAAKVVAVAADTAEDEVAVLFDDGANGCRDHVGFPTTPVFINTGRIRYGVYDAKLSASVAPRVEPLPDLAALSVDANYDGSDVRHVGDLVGFGVAEFPEPFKLPYVPHEWCELRFSFSAGGNPSVWELPVLVRWVLRAVPNPKKAEEIILPLRYEHVSVDGDAVWAYDVGTELKWLREMCATHPMEYVDGPLVTTVYINDIKAHAVSRTLANDAWEGTVTLQLRTVI